MTGRTPSPAIRRTVSAASGRGVSATPTKPSTVRSQTRSSRVSVSAGRLSRRSAIASTRSPSAASRCTVRCAARRRVASSMAVPGPAAPAAGAFLPGGLSPGSTLAGGNPAAQRQYDLRGSLDDEQRLTIDSPEGRGVAAVGLERQLGPQLPVLALPVPALPVLALPVLALPVLALPVLALPVLALDRKSV